MPRWADVQKTMGESLRHGETIELKFVGDHGCAYGRAHIHARAGASERWKAHMHYSVLSCPCVGRPGRGLREQRRVGNGGKKLVIRKVRERRIDGGGEQEMLTCAADVYYSLALGKETCQGC